VSRSQRVVAVVVAVLTTQRRDASAAIVGGASAGGAPGPAPSRPVAEATRPLEWKIGPHGITDEAVLAAPLHLRELLARLIGVSAEEIIPATACRTACTSSRPGSLGLLSSDMRP
jgi:hypothetical protein